MRTALLVGGPLILFTWFSLHSDLITYGEQHPGIMHIAGVEPGETFSLVHEETYQCDENGNNCVLVEENTEFGEIEGLELEETPIEYREGDEITTARKLNGMNKYGPIHLRRGTFDNVNFKWSSLRFEFERQAEIERINQEYDEKIREAQEEAE